MSKSHLLFLLRQFRQALYALMVSNGGGTFLTGVAVPVVDISVLTGFIRFPIVGSRVMLALLDGPRGTFVLCWPDMVGFMGADSTVEPLGKYEYKRLNNTSDWLRLSAIYTWSGVIC